MWGSHFDGRFTRLKLMEQSRKRKQGKHPEKVLSAIRVRALAEPGRYIDGNGLYLEVDVSGAKRWTLRTVIHGKRCDVGLGGLALVSLAQAREEAARLRRIARAGGDPLTERRKERQVVPTFEAAARQVHEARRNHFATRSTRRNGSQLLRPTYFLPLAIAAWITSNQPMCSKRYRQSGWKFQRRPAVYASG